MHELAIAQRVIETAVALLPPHTEHISKLSIQLGELAGVSEDELRFGIEFMAGGTPCAGSELEIAHVPAIAHCLQCGVDFPVTETDLLFCPTCSTPAVVIVQGKELVIASIEVNGERANAG